MRFYATGDKMNNGKKTFERWVELKTRLGKKIYPYRWYLFGMSIVFGFLAALYF
jgi:hypothetical protein